MKLFEPLYSPDLGLVGFRCRCGACTRVVRTQRGAEMHCWRKHKIKAQMEIDYEAKASAEPQLVRGELGAEARGDVLFLGPAGECPHCGKQDCRCNVDVL